MIVYANTIQLITHHTIFTFYCLLYRHTVETNTVILSTYSRYKHVKVTLYMYHSVYTFRLGLCIPIYITIMFTNVLYSFSVSWMFEQRRQHIILAKWSPFWSNVITPMLVVTSKKRDEEVSKNTKIYYVYWVGFILFTITIHHSKNTLALELHHVNVSKNTTCQDTVHELISPWLG